jgi:hypothetical protein
MNKTAGFLAAVATLALAGSVEAQICAGFPTGDRGMYFGGRADFPDGGDSFGVEANYNASGPLGVYGGLDVVSVDGVDDSDQNIYRAGVAFEVVSLGMMIGPRVSACPVVEAKYTSEEDVGSVLQVPIGLGLGANLGLPLLPSLAGYVQPQLVVTHVNFDEDIPLVEDETETDFGVKAGVMAGFGLISVGGEVQHVFVDGADPVFGVRVGLRF